MKKHQSNNNNGQWPERLGSFHNLMTPIEAVMFLRLVMAELLCHYVLAIKGRLMGTLLKTFVRASKLWNEKQRYVTEMK